MGIPKHILEDTDPMPFGKFTGTPMADVPAWYLIWLYENNIAKGNVKRYIKANLELLEKENSKTKK